jgi:DNA uptake protein ComE-like DNA-binding protein
LEDIPGIGPSLAKKIMVLREENMFPKWSDIDAISGIGSKKLAVLKENLILDE